MVSPADGTVEAVNRTDRWRPDVDAGDTRGGRFVSLIGTDGVRLVLERHLQRRPIVEAVLRRCHHPVLEEAVGPVDRIDLGVAGHEADPANPGRRVQLHEDHLADAVAWDQETATLRVVQELPGHIAELRAVRQPQAHA